MHMEGEEEKKNVFFFSKRRNVYISIATHAYLAYTSWTVRQVYMHLHYLCLAGNDRFRLCRFGIPK